MLFLLLTMTNDNTRCMICLVKCLTPGTLHLLCDCKYKVHYRCYQRWYKVSPTCIICHQFAFPPSKKGDILDPVTMTQWREARGRPKSCVDKVRVREQLVRAIVVSLGLILLYLEVCGTLSESRIRNGIAILIITILWFTATLVC